MIRVRRTRILGEKSTVVLSVRMRWNCWWPPRQCCRSGSIQWYGSRPLGRKLKSKTISNTKKSRFYPFSFSLLIHFFPTPSVFIFFPAAIVFCKIYTPAKFWYFFCTNSVSLFRCTLRLVRVISRILIIESCIFKQGCILYIRPKCDIYVPHPFSRIIIFPWNSEIFFTFSPYICVFFLNNTSYFYPNQPITHKFAPCSTRNICSDPTRKWRLLSLKSRRSWKRELGKMALFIRGV